MTSDEELMLQYQGGSESAFQELYRRHGGRVYGYLRHRVEDSATADDLLQLTFMKLHKSRENYDPKLPFLPWLFWICKTVWLDHLRKLKGGGKVTSLDPETQRGLLDQNTVPAQDVQSAHADSVEQLEKLAPAVAQLRKQEQEALDLRYTQELPFDEIAKRLGLSQVSARKRVSRAVQALKNLLTVGPQNRPQNREDGPGKTDRERK